MVRGRLESSSFSKEYTEYAGGGGQWPLYASLNVDYDALHFLRGLVKSTFSKYSFVREGEVTQKEYSVYAFNNVDNYG